MYSSAEPLALCLAAGAEKKCPRSFYYQLTRRLSWCAVRGTSTCIYAVAVSRLRPLRSNSNSFTIPIQQRLRHRTQISTHAHTQAKNIHAHDYRMPPCIEKARAIMRVLTEDMWNHRAKHERTRLWRMYCSPQIKAYTPDGGESTGYEEVCHVLSYLAEAPLCSLPSHSRITHRCHVRSTHRSHSRITDEGYRINHS